MGGDLYSYRLDSQEAGLFLLLTDKVVHPAYYGADCIESLHIGPHETIASGMGGASTEAPHKALHKASSKAGFSREIIVSRCSDLCSPQ